MFVRRGRFDVEGVWPVPLFDERGRQCSQRGLVALLRDRGSGSGRAGRDSTGRRVIVAAIHLKAKKSPEFEALRTHTIPQVIQARTWRSRRAALKCACATLTRGACAGCGRPPIKLWRRRHPNHLARRLQLVSRARHVRDNQELVTSKRVRLRWNRCVHTVPDAPQQPMHSPRLTVAAWYAWLQSPSSRRGSSGRGLTARLRARST